MNAQVNSWKQRVDEVISDDDYTLLELICFVGEVTDFTKSQSHWPNDEWLEVRGMSSRIGDYLYEELDREITWSLIRPRKRIPSLIKIKDILKDPRIPTWVKRRLQPEIQKVYNALNQGSVDKAESLVFEVEECLGCAERNVANAHLPARERLNWVVPQTAKAERLLADIPKHVKSVGLPEVARQRGVSVEVTLDSFQARIRDLNQKVPELQELAQYEAEHAEEIAAEQRARDAEVERLRQAEQKQRERDQLFTAISIRSKPAGEAAKQFYASLATGNLVAARVFLNRVRSLDFGVPALMQKDYGEAARRLVKPLKIA